jgi:hypothetical protein
MRNCDCGVMLSPNDDPMSRSRLPTRPKRPPLNIEQVLSWADDWFAAHNRWPNVKLRSHSRHDRRQRVAQVARRVACVEKCAMCILHMRTRG